MPESDKSVDKVLHAVQDRVPLSWRNLGLEGVDVIFGRRPVKRRTSFDLTGAVADKLRPKVCQALLSMTVQHVCQAAGNAGHQQIDVLDHLQSRHDCC